MIAEARARYGRIAPCRGKSFTQCFLEQDGKVQFWFNDSTGNTHLLYVDQEQLNYSFT